MPPNLRESLMNANDHAVALRPLRTGDAGWVLARHGEIYALEEGYDQSFEAVVASILAGFLTRASPRERGWIAHRGVGTDEERLGCAFVMAEQDEASTCRLRLVLVEPHARGLGLGQRLLDEAISWARTKGYRRMVLWTHESHRAAGKLYARNGFTLQASMPTEAFGQNVVDETWSRDL
jgi:GNAT superfamily N-acetyltransferase